jgi:hypothetical protein
LQKQIDESGFTPEQVDVINLLINEEIRRRMIRGDEYFVGDAEYYKIPSYSHFRNAYQSLQDRVQKLEGQISDMLQTAGYVRRMLKWLKSLLSRSSSQ